MDNMESDLVTILKWVGILALISVPLVLLARKEHSTEAKENRYEDSDIFSEQLTG